MLPEIESSGAITAITSHANHAAIERVITGALSVKTSVSSWLIGSPPPEVRGGMVEFQIVDRSQSAE